MVAMQQNITIVVRGVTHDIKSTDKSYHEAIHALLYYVPAMKRASITNKIGTT